MPAILAATARRGAVPKPTAAAADTELRRPIPRGVIAAAARPVSLAMPSLSPARGATAALLTGRLLYGAGLLAVPSKLAAGRWLGAGAKAPAATVALRGMGARETLLHAGALAATVSGRPVRPWLAASMAGDLVDVAATAAVRRGLPDGSAVATAVVAGGGALLSGVLAALVDA